MSPTHWAWCVTSVTKEVVQVVVVYAPLKETVHHASQVVISCCHIQPHILKIAYLGVSIKQDYELKDLLWMFHWREFSRLKLDRQHRNWAKTPGLVYFSHIRLSVSRRHLIADDNWCGSSVLMLVILKIHMKRIWKKIDNKLISWILIKWNN